MLISEENRNIKLKKIQSLVNIKENLEQILIKLSDNRTVISVSCKYQNEKFHNHIIQSINNVNSMVRDLYIVTYKTELMKINNQIDLLAFDLNNENLCAEEIISQ